MNARMAPAERTRKMRLRLWLSAALALGGALLLTLGSCSSASPPDSPTAAQAGSINGDPSTVVGSSVSAATSDATSSAPISSSSSPAATRSSSRSAASSATASSATASSTTASAPTSSTPDKTSTSTSAPNTSVTPLVPLQGPILGKSKPTTLTIPAIGVSNSPVLDMSLGADGAIEVPPLNDTKSSGWYDQSPTPGERGPSILLGHVDSAANGPSVFYKLGDLKPGDTVEVNRADGTVAVFKVDGVREYSKSKFPTDTVYGNLNFAGLRLITCGGTFNPSVGHYESNIIAFASLVSSHQA